MDNVDSPRYWWLKRLGPLAVVLLASMVGSYWALGLWADWRVEQELAEWRKLPVIQPQDTLGTAADLADPKNPAFHVQAAVGALPRYTTEQMEWESQDRPSPMIALTERDVKVIGSFDAGLRPRLAALRQARSAAEKQEYRWALGPLSVSTLLPHLNPMREVCNQIGWVMLLAHHDGDIARAMELAQLNRTLSESCLAYGNALVCSLVATGIEAVAHRRIAELAGHEPADRTLEQELALWRRDREQVKALIDELMDDAYYERLAVEGMDGEWLVGLNIRTPMPGWGMSLPSRNPLTAPMLDVNALDLLAVYEQYRSALAENQGYPDRMQALGKIKAPPSPASIAAVAARSAFHEFGISDMERPVRSYARVETTGYAAAVALASRLFEADHGRLPASLEEMLPDYLPRIPEDPFDPAGGPPRYVVIDGVPVVYSVGENGTDEGGSLLNHDKYEYYENYADDYVFPLRYPARMNHDPVKWLRQRQERQASLGGPASSRAAGAGEAE